MVLHGPSIRNEMSFSEVDAVLKGVGVGGGGVMNMYLMHAHARDIDLKLMLALFTGVSYVKASLVKYIRHRFVHARLT